MKKHLILALGAAAIITSASAAQAQERWPRWYIGLSGSVAFLNDGDISGGGMDDFEGDTGWGASVALGYTPPLGAPLNNTRWELEYTYRGNDIGDIAGAATSTGGDFNSQALMLNAYYDFAMGNRWMPYVGAGVGISRGDIDVGTGTFFVDDADWAWAYQLMAGIGYSPATMPMTVWHVGYRWFQSEDLRVGANVGNIEVEQSYHNLEAGVKFRF